MTTLFGVIGDPISHSLSPLIHKGWMRDHGLDTDYLAMQVAEGGLPDALATLAGRNCRGVNVTLPHKETALQLAETATERATMIGAANTLWRVGETQWRADNTDAPGFRAALTGESDKPVAGQRVLVFGAGGAARAVVYALHEDGAKICLANRTLSRAKDLLARYPQGDHSAASLDEGYAFATQADLVINTTSLGYSGAGLPLPDGAGRLLYDISYGKVAAGILGPAAENGWRTADGLTMLVYQAAFAFERWFGIMPDIATALARCRGVLEAAR